MGAVSCSLRPFPAVFFCYTILASSVGPYHDRIRAVATAQMTVSTFFALLAAARNRTPNTVAAGDNLGSFRRRVGFQPLLQVRSTRLSKKLVFPSLYESKYDAVYVCVAFKRAEDVLWSEDGSNAWFPFLCNTVEISDVPTPERVSNNQTLRRTQRQVREHSKVWFPQGRVRPAVGH